MATISLRSTTRNRRMNVVGVVQPVRRPYSDRNIGAFNVEFEYLLEYAHSTMFGQTIAFTCQERWR